MERFKFAYPEDGVRPSSFTRERFFDFSDGLTNIRPDVHERWAAYYRRLEEKWDDLAYVGDKITQIGIQRLWRTIPEAKFVCIVRDVEAVAASWDRRARNETDRAWSPASDARASVAQWNRGMRRIRRAVRQRPEQAAVVEYDHFFGDPDGASLRAVCDWLGLEPAEELRDEFARMHEQYRSVLNARDRRLSPADAEFVEQHAERRAWNALRQIAL